MVDKTDVAGFTGHKKRSRGGPQTLITGLSRKDPSGVGSSVQQSVDPPLALIGAETNAVLILAFSEVRARDEAFARLTDGLGGSGKG